MRILHTSDWHIGRFLNSFSLLDDQAYFLNWLFTVLVDEKIDLLLICGDVYNTASPSAAAVSLLDDFFTKVILDLKIKVAIISGNHDSAEKLCFSSRILQKSGFFVAGGLKNVQCVNLNFDGVNLSLCLLPFFNYTDAKALFKLAKNFDDDEVFSLIFQRAGVGGFNNSFSIMCAHGLFVDCNKHLNFCDSELNVGGSDAVDLSRLKNFDYVALGHLHGPQQAGANGVYCGSPIKYSVSEANHKKRVVVVDVTSKTNFKVSSITVSPLHDLKVVKGVFSDVVKLKTTDYVSVQLTDSTFVMGAYAKIQANCPNILDLQFVNLNFDISSNLKEIKKTAPLDLFEDFYVSVVGRKMNDEERQVFLKVTGQL